MENTLLETILDEIHESTNGPLKLLKVLDKEIITVNVDDKMFLILHDILAPFEEIIDSVGDIDVLVLTPSTITIKLPSRARIYFIRTAYSSPYTFQIVPK